MRARAGVAPEARPWRRVLLWGAVAAIAVLTLSSCGGGGHGPTADTTSSSSHVTAASPAQRLSAYLAAMLPLHRALNADEAKLKAALHTVTGSDRPRWPVAGAEIKRLIPEFQAEAVKIREITPPPGLAGAHGQYLGAVTTLEVALGTMATDLLGKNTSAVISWPDTINPQLDAAHVATLGWRTAIEAAAAEAGVAVPGWVQQVGS